MTAVLFDGHRTPAFTSKRWLLQKFWFNFQLFTQQIPDTHSVMTVLIFFEKTGLKFCCDSFHLQFLSGTGLYDTAFKSSSSSIVRRFLSRWVHSLSWSFFSFVSWTVAYVLLWQSLCKLFELWHLSWSLFSTLENRILQENAFPSFQISQKLTKIKERFKRTNPVAYICGSLSYSGECILQKMIPVTLRHPCPCGEK